MEEPNLSCEKVDKADPNRPKALRETELAKFPYPRMEAHEPTRVCPNTETALPTFSKLRSERELPRSTKFKTDREAFWPNLTCESIDKVDPAREKPLSDKLDPRLNMSRIDKLAVCPAGPVAFSPICSFE
jgi:hypothetical protein